MSIERIGNVWEVACDECGAEEGFTFLEEFIEIVDQLKKYGWKIFKDEDDEWTHICSDCSGIKPKVKGNELFDFSDL